jgi:hypothetical protein
MTPGDLPAMLIIADIVHPAYPEAAAVFIERLALYPQGCLVLENGEAPVGYIVSHPWLYGEPPRLNSLLESVPVNPTTYYIHDIALLPEARGTGAAASAVERLVVHSGLHGFSNLSLIAVNNSVEFWRRHAFHAVEDSKLARKLLSYDANARFLVREIIEPTPGAT